MGPSTPPRTNRRVHTHTRARWCVAWLALRVCRLSEAVMKGGVTDPLHDKRTARTLPVAFAHFWCAAVDAPALR